MPTAPADMSTLEPAAAIAELGERVRHSLRRSGHAPGVVRVEVPITAPNPAVWLAAQPPGGRTYWADRDRSFVAAGTGDALTLSVTESSGPRSLFDRIDSLLAGSSGDARFFGGLRFDSARPVADHWQSFGFGRFILPRFELVARGDNAVLAANLVLPDDLDRAEEILHTLAQLSFDTPQPQTGHPGTLGRFDNPERGPWMALVQQAVESIRRGEMDKIVLARESRFDLEHAIDPMALVGQLHTASPRCFIFCFEPTDCAALIGASPERLYRRNGRSVSSEAVAGTRPRGATADEDARLGDKLLTSQKEAREHAFVADAIRHVLTEYCRSIRGDDERAIIKLARVQHLITRFEGELNETATDADLLDRLHPTPAVGGVPTDTAKAAIRDLETFDRGWYAGPVGWISRDSAEFAVGIRSALVGRDTLRLFSGAGIVEGSHPDREWDEIENKISGFLRLLAAS